MLQSDNTKRNFGVSAGLILGALTLICGLAFDFKTAIAFLGMIIGIVYALWLTTIFYNRMSRNDHLEGIVQFMISMGEEED